MFNAECMEYFVAGLAASGVSAACVSPGSRSSPLTLALEAHPGIDCHMVLDERSSAFCALGMAKSAQRPVVTACTSGTAAANFHPAVIEADLAQVPLIVLTADRPPELRGRGAAQTIDQIGLFGRAVREFREAPVPDGRPETRRWFGTEPALLCDRATGLHPGPVHVNLPFREPLIERPVGHVTAPTPPRCTVHAQTAGSAGIVAAAEDLARTIAGVDRGLIVCGWQPRPFDPDLGDAVAQLATATAWPVLADAASGVRFGTAASGHVLAHADLIARHGPTAEALVPEVVVRVGGWPISKPIAALTAAAQRHLYIDPCDWADPDGVVTDVIRVHAPRLLRAMAAYLVDLGPRPQAVKWSEMWMSAHDVVTQALSRHWDAQARLTESSLAATVTRHLPAGGALCVGPSMPLRDVDTFSVGGPGRISVFCNRGANGMDGFVSTCVGIARVHDGPVVALCGDLTLAHDGLALGLAEREGLPITFVVADNAGGGIFAFLPQADICSRAVLDRCFVSPGAHAPDVLARAAGCEFRQVQRASDLVDIVTSSAERPAPLVVAVPSDIDSNVADHKHIWAQVAAAMDSEWRFK